MKVDKNKVVILKLNDFSDNFKNGFSSIEES